jgi:hypothetical protein
MVILGNMGIIKGDIWGYVWPLFLILLGGSMILKRTRREEKIFGHSGRPADDQVPKT